MRDKFDEMAFSIVNKTPMTISIETAIADALRSVDESARVETKQKSRRARLLELYRERYPEKKSAHNAVYRALRQGTIKKQPCHCGSKDVHAHHDDYSKQLEVMWLCPKHHGERHAQIGTDSHPSRPTKGVKYRESGRWQASIKFGGKTVTLGTFDSKEEASEAYWAKRNEIAETGVL